MRRLYCLISFIVSSICCFSQQLQIELNQGEHDMLEGNPLSFVVNYSQEENVNIIDASLKCIVNNDTIADVATTLTDGILSVVNNTVSIGESMQEGKYHILFALQYDTINDAEKKDTITVSVLSEAIDITVWRHASASLSGNFNAIKSKKARYSIELDGGQKEGWQPIVWKVNESVVTTERGNELVYTIPEDYDKETLIVEAIAICTTGSIVEEFKNLSIVTNVYNIPTTEEPNKTDYNPYYSGDGKIVLSFNVDGGCTATSTTEKQQGWEFHWYSGTSQNTCNTLVQTTKHALFNVDDNVEAETNTYYRVECHNWVDGVDYFANKRKEYVFYTHIYAKPELKELSHFQVFFGEDFEISADVTKNGYPGGWTYVWKKDGKEISYDSKCIIPAVQNSSNLEKEDVLGYTLNVKNNKANGDTWKLWEDIPVKITAYALPGIERLAYDQDIYSGQELKLGVKQVAGIDGQWYHAWKYSYVDEMSERSTIDLNPTSGVSYANITSSYTTNGTSNVRELHVADNCYNGWLAKKEFCAEFDVRVWPQVVFPDRIDCETLKVRDGNSLTAKLAHSTGGYYSDSKDRKSKNLFSLSLEDNECMLDNSDKNSCVFENVEGGFDNSFGRQETRTRKLRGSIFALGPDGKTWASKNYEEDVVIYKRPINPKSLTVKGNGTSGTIIVQMDASDSDLQNMGYGFIFGNGDRILATTTDRYYVVGENVSNNNNLWVTTYWDYEDGTRIAGYRRYLDGTIDVSSDDSNVSVSRSDDADGIALANVNGNKNCVYDVHGQKATLDGRGLRILRMSDGSVKKIMVK